MAAIWNGGPTPAEQFATFVHIVNVQQYVMYILCKYDVDY